MSLVLPSSVTLGIKSHRDGRKKNCVKFITPTNQPILYAKTLRTCSALNIQIDCELWFNLIYLCNACFFFPSAVIQYLTMLMMAPVILKSIEHQHYWIAPPFALHHSLCVSFVVAHLRISSNDYCCYYNQVVLYFIILLQSSFIQSHPIFIVTANSNWTNKKNVTMEFPWTS